MICCRYIALTGQMGKGEFDLNANEHPRNDNKEKFNKQTLVDRVRQFVTEMESTNPSDFVNTGGDSAGKEIVVTNSPGNNKNFAALGKKQVPDQRALILAIMEFVEA